MLNTALSGLEAECPSDAQLEKLDGVVMHKARKLLGRKAVEEQPDGTMHRISDERIRRMLEKSNLHRLLMARKLMWLRDILTCKEDNVQVMASVFGRLEEDTTGCTDSNPWLLKWLDGLQKLSDIENAGVNVYEKYETGSSFMRDNEQMR